MVNIISDPLSDGQSSDGPTDTRSWDLLTINLLHTTFVASFELKSPALLKPVYSLQKSQNSSLQTIEIRCFWDVYYHYFSLLVTRVATDEKQEILEIRNEFRDMSTIQRLLNG